MLGNKNHLTQQSQLAIELFQRVVMLGDLSYPELFNLAYKLWNLSQKHLENSKLKYFVSAVNHIFKTKNTANIYYFYCRNL